MKQASNFNSLVNWHDFRECAKNTLSDSAWAYFEGAAADEISKNNNIKAWQDLSLHNRVLQKFSQFSTQTELLGQTIEWPLIVAPMAHQKWAHQDGELAMALAASALDVGMTLSIQSSCSMQAVAKVYQPQKKGGLLWIQLYWTHLNQVLEWIEEAKNCGYQAVVLTVDSAVQGSRDEQMRHGFKLPKHAQSVHWPSKCHPTGHNSSQASLLELLKQAPTWSDIEQLIELSSLPIFLKGISHAQDAQNAMSLDIAGIIVSNHGGRNLDTVADSVQLIRSIAPKVQAYRHKNKNGNQKYVLLDGGIRRGTDVVKALALGADAVLIGRPCIYGLASAGSQGVAQVLKNIQTEIIIAMSLLACSTIQAINSSVLNESHP